jgi:hypothetical protein
MESIAGNEDKFCNENFSVTFGEEPAPSDLSPTSKGKNQSLFSVPNDSERSMTSRLVGESPEGYESVLGSG